MKGTLRSVSEEYGLFTAGILIVYSYLEGNIYLTLKSLVIFVEAPHESSTPVKQHTRHRGLEIDLLLTTVVSSVEDSGTHQRS